MSESTAAVPLDRKAIDPSAYAKAMLNILTDFSEEKGRLQDMQRAMLNILGDAGEERSHLRETQRAILNVLDDAGEERGHLRETQRAMLNILGDAGEERGHLEETQRAMLNILDDVGEERAHLEETQQAILNILDDAGEERAHLEETQQAILNILDDAGEERGHLEETQRAMLNILGDAGEERRHLEDTQRAVLNILNDAHDESNRVHDTQRAVLNILEDFAGEKSELEATQRAVLNILEDVNSERNERRQAEAMVRALNDDLEARVVQRTAALTAANQELEAFSYSSSHVLGAPLRAISGFCGILLEDYGDRLDAEGRRMLGILQASAGELSQLIADILGFLQLGRRQLVLTRLDMSELVRAALKELEAQAKDRKIALELHPLPPARGDTGMIQRVWTSLLDNALKFTASKPGATIAVGTTAGQGETVYYVRDNGVGFDMRYVHKLFGVFERLHGSEFAGTGIGLATVRRIVTRHGGRVWAEGKLDEGATFYFTLPVTEAADA